MSHPPHGGEDGEHLRSVDEHLEALLALVEPLPPFDVQLLDAHGCALAEDVTAPADLPPFDNSAMDGYVVRAADVAGATPQQPVRLPVVGDIAAGDGGAYRVQPGLCARIMTGAPVPPGGDAIVPVEWTDGGTVVVSITRAPDVGAYVRRAGSDLTAGTPVLASGARLGATQIAALASAGRERIAVRPRPRVVVMSTGSELVDPGQPLGPGQIHDSNSYLLTAAVREAGAIAYRIGAVPDDPRELTSTIEDQLVRADLVLTSGGVSAGAYDVVKEVLGRLGTVSFCKVAMQPGMPQGYGTVGPDSTPIITLPGNPVSAYVSFEVFVRPVLRRMLGVTPLERPRVRAVSTEAITSPAGKRQYRRGWLDVVDGRYAVRPVGGPGSHLVAALAHANCLVVVPEGVTEVPAGSPVTVMVLERRQG